LIILYSAIGARARYLPKYFIIPLGELTLPEPTLKKNLLFSLYSLETVFSAKFLILGLG